MGVLANTRSKLTRCLPFHLQPLKNLFLRNVESTSFAVGLGILRGDYLLDIKQQLYFVSELSHRGRTG